MRAQDYDIIESLHANISCMPLYTGAYAYVLLLDRSLKVVRLMSDVPAVQTGSPPLLAYFLATIVPIFCV